MKLPDVSSKAYILITIALSCAGGFFVIYSLTDADIFWHLAAGREIIARKQFLFCDPFAFTPTNTLWIDVHWLFQVAVFSIYTIGGYLLMIIVKGIIVGLAVALLLTSFPNTVSTIAVASLLVLTIYFQRYLIPMRPIIFTLLYSAAFIACYEHFIKSGKRRWPLLLLAIEILWANSQGLFLMGPAIGITYAAGEYLNRLLNARAPALFTYNNMLTKKQQSILYLLPGALTAVSVVNPYGGKALLFASKLFVRIAPSDGNIYSSTITENMPLLTMIGTQYAHYPIIIGILLLLILYTAGTTFRQLRVSLIGLVIAGFILAFMAQRNGIIFTFFAFPALFYHSHLLAEKYKSPAATIVPALLAGTAIAIMAVGIIHTAMLRQWPHTISPFNHPVTSSSYLAQHHHEGNLFNADRHGGYLIWNNFPDEKVSSDTRLTLRSHRFYSEYLSIVNTPEKFDPYAAQWRITKVVLPLTPITLYHPLATYLYRHPDWKLVSTNGEEALFFAKAIQPDSGLSLNNSRTVDSIAATVESTYATAPSICNEALDKLARWCMETGSYNGAETVLSRASTLNSTLLLASVKAKQGLIPEAEGILLATYKQHPENHQIIMTLVYLQLNSGLQKKALENLRLLVKRAPSYKPAQKMLTTLTQQPER